MDQKQKRIIISIIIATVVLLAVGVGVWHFTASAAETPQPVEVVNDIPFDDEMAERQRLAEEARLAEEQAEAERVAAEQAEAERLAAEQAEAERLAAEQAAYQEPVYYEQESYYAPSNGGGLTRSGGVNYYNGNRETWYSSNTLYHYRTGEWTVGADGVYRDADGYVVAASSDYGQGSTIDTSFGAGKVYDSGCASGTVDIYTKW